MKTVKLVLGIISLVLCCIVLFQSCAANVYTSMSGDKNDLSAGSGFLFFLLMLVAGITGIAARKSRGGSITAAVFYVLAGLMGVSSSGVFKDLQVWGGRAGHHLRRGPVLLRRPQGHQKTRGRIIHRSLSRAVKGPLFSVLSPDRQFAKVFIVSIHEVCYAFEDEHSKEEATDGKSQRDLRRKLL